ncbi:glutamic acid-rich protein-like [Lytechinus variegatus]|uniref:glutamic acid-rich protein-like n=1 Tax=Lytechinus variegatus TaxID=7654 RepID=UPI001BB17936|nr:glutamic acid-rich protein-like [Lytechinus variegatus]
MALFGSLFRLPRRRMAGKRMFIGVLCTVCLVLGVYIKFFNHESSDNLLSANRQSVQGDDVIVVAANKPNFHRIGTNNKINELNKDFHEFVPKERADNFAAEEIYKDDTPQGDDDEKVVLEKAEHEGNEEDGDVHEENKKDEVNGGNEEEGNEEKLDEWADDHQEENPNDIRKDETNDYRDAEEQPLDVDRPVERLEGGEDGEEGEELRNAGGDGGEQKEEEEEGGDEEEEEKEEERENKEDEENEEAEKKKGDNTENEEEKEDAVEDDKKQTGRGPHGIKLFDWNNWVKENQFVELGNVWGYCDDADPPVIGKLILLEDEELGGVKTIFLFNTTLDIDVLIGKVEISIDYNDMHFYEKTFNLEDLEEQGDFFKAPILKGDHYFVREKHISRFVPKGHYYGEARMTDQNERVIICSTMNLHMK